MQSVITLRDPSIVAARMDLAEMASIVVVTINLFLSVSDQMLSSFHDNKLYNNIRLSSVNGI